MPIEYGNHTFEGPYRSSDTIEVKPGVYVIICEGPKKYYLLDVGESETLRIGTDNYEH